jgi:hypothetical protein
MLIVPIPWATGINDQGQVVGFYRVFGSGTLHGFIATLGENNNQDSQ